MWPTEAPRCKDAHGSMEELNKHTEFLTVKVKTMSVTAHINQNALLISPSAWPASPSEPLSQRLAHALFCAPEQFSVHYQPIWDLTENTRPIAYEALARWSSPCGAGPNEFIPLLALRPIWRRRFNAILIERLIMDVQRMLHQGLTVSHVSMNITYSDLAEPHFVQCLLTQTERCPDIRSRLILEITETELITHTPKFMANVLRLKNAGIALALDDFGQGYANIQSLAMPMLSIIKLDKCLIDNIEHCHTAYLALQKVIELCQTFHHKVVIEGVETVRQTQLISAMNMPNVWVQGYYYAKPLPLQEINTRYTSDNPA